MSREAAEPSFEEWIAAKVEDVRWSGLGHGGERIERKR